MAHRTSGHPFLTPARCTWMASVVLALVAAPAAAQSSGDALCRDQVAPLVHQPPGNDALGRTPHTPLRRTGAATSWFRRSDAQADLPRQQAREPHGTITHVAVTAYAIGQFTDGMVTTFLMGRGGYHEANPVLRPFEQRPLAMAAIKGGMAAATVWALARAHQEHPRAALLTAIGLTAVQAAVTYHNHRLTRTR